MTWMTWDNFVEKVRSFNSDSLLGEVAIASARNSKEQSNAVFPSPHEDFLLAVIAKTSIFHADPNQRRAASPTAVRSLCSQVLELEGRAGEDARQFLVRMAYEQFPTQETPLYPLCRTHALLGVAAERRKLPELSDTAWQSRLGCSLAEFARLALLLHSALKLLSGQIGHSSADAFLSELPSRSQFSDFNLRAVVNNSFVADTHEFRAALKKEDVIDDARLKRYEYNPLLRHPIIRLGSGSWVAPALSYLRLRASPTSLYYQAVQSGAGNRFAEELGTAFEEYVGMQLGLVAGACVTPEREFEKGKKSADFTLRIGSLVIVVECKITRMTYRARFDKQKMESDFERTPERAIAQVEATSQLIKQRHRAFSDLADATQLIGLVLTLEPYHIINDKRLYKRQPEELNTAVCYVGDLERLVCLEGRLFEERILSALTKPKTGDWVFDALDQQNPGRNRVIDASWEVIRPREI